MDKGWYILVALTVALIILLIGFAIYMTIESRHHLCPTPAACSTPRT